MREEAEAEFGGQSEEDLMNDQVMRERDEAEERMTRLAEAVGDYFGVPVGEWSSANDPVEEAHKILNGEYITKFDKPLRAAKKAQR